MALDQPAEAPSDTIVALEEHEEQAGAGAGPGLGALPRCDFCGEICASATRDRGGP